ncbi:MAG: hypothetical protein K6D95_03825 [Treponema sp.]|nr:hypothetical protein [Treponema sp.]
MKKNFVLFGLLAFVLSAQLFAADVKAGSVKAPGKGKVILVGRVSLKKDFDFKARALALGYGEKAASTPVKYCIGDASVGTQSYELSEPFYYTVKVEKDGTVKLPYFHVVVAGYEYFRLPCAAKVTVPEGSSYVYVGNFEYDLDYALRVAGFKHYDEFDKAEEWINTATGKECNLIRAEFEFE